MADVCRESEINSFDYQANKEGTEQFGNHNSTINHKFKKQFLVLREEEFVDFERELRGSGSMTRGNRESW